MNLRDIARALGGDVNGDKVLAPGPGHSKFDRSMAVYIDPSAPSLVRCHSFAGDAWQDCLKYTFDRLGIGEAWEKPKTWERSTTSPSTDDRDRTMRALSIWGEARSLQGTPGMAYLARRGVDIEHLSPRIGEALRWHPACPWEQGRHGCMVALMTDAITAEPRAIHRTAITSEGRKVDKKMLGPSAGTVIRLWPDDDVTTGLVLGEGVETTLVAATTIVHRGTRLAPAWAAASANAMAGLPVLNGIESLTLLVDNDASGAGQKAAMACSARWTAAGREVIRLTPSQTGQDFADIGSAAA